MLPHFFVIGAQKAGSTYLLHCLGEHPEIFMPPGEVAFFEESLYSTERIGDFEKHFARARPGQVVGVKRPNLLGHSECPERLKRHMPDLKIIAILRHPIERSVSGYFHYMKTGLLPIEPVEVGMRKIIEGQYPEIPRAREVLEFGLYGKHLNHYSEYYPRENFYVMLLEDMKHDAASQLAGLYRFLGVAADFHPHSFDSRPMKAPYSITRLRLWDALDRLCRTWTADGKYFERKRGLLTTPLVALNNALDRHVWERIFPAPRPRLPESLQEELAAFYRDDARCLQQWLGRPIRSWGDILGPSTTTATT
jgi:Sulfotransferase domain